MKYAVILKNNPKIRERKLLLQIWSELSSWLNPFADIVLLC